ncbi:MAG: hypothetical protein H0V12_01155 [Chloroflexi bacterium]|nr:hypothetical protein [Chloroflexota bacterium]
MTPDERRRRRLRLATIALILLAIIAAAVYWYVNNGPGRASPAGSTVVELAGAGNQSTEPFTVRPGWRIEWQNTGDQFFMAITGDRDFGTVVEQQEPGSGVTSPSGAGTYRIDVRAAGEWSITVVQGD